jgi:putative endonuclease
VAFSVSDIFMPHFIYILYSEKLDKYYIGRTEDLSVRLEFHNNPIESRKFTARGIPWVIVFSFECESLKEAELLEKTLKKMKSRKFIERLT